MLTVWRLVEALPRFVDRFWFTFYLDPERSSDDVDDDGKRMGVWCREPAGRIGNFNQLHLKPAGVQVGQYLGKGDPGSYCPVMLAISGGLSRDRLGADHSGASQS